MRLLRTGLLCLLAIPLLPASDDLVKPDKLNISTWVREDLFAGWIMNDADTFDRGERKLDRYLQDHPDNTTGLSWKYFAIAYRTRQALERAIRPRISATSPRPKPCAKKSSRRIPRTPVPTSS